MKEGNLQKDDEIFKLKEMLEQRNSLNKPINIQQGISTGANIQGNIQGNIHGNIQGNIHGQQNLQGIQGIPTIKTIVSNNMLPPNPQNINQGPQSYGPSSRS